MAKSTIQPTQIHLTQSGLHDLERELEQLKNERPHVVKELESMRSLGDLKENAAYEIQKSKLSFLDGRIAELEDLTKNAQVIEKTSDGTVGIGSVVTLHIVNDKVTYQLVGETEADITQGKISATSPIGTALLGKSKGDKISVEAPGGNVLYEILHID